MKNYFYTFLLIIGIPLCLLSIVSINNSIPYSNTFEKMRCIHMGGNWGLSVTGTITHPADYFKFLHNLNVNWVGISVALHIDDSMDSTVERKYTRVNIPTFTDETLKNTIRAFQSNGFNVYLTLAFETQNSEVAIHPVARWQLGDPKMPDEDPNILPEYWPWSLDHPNHESFVNKFWATYTEQAVHFGKIADEEGISLYSLGTETERLFRTRSGGRWPNDFGNQLKTMVDSVRTVYSGLLTYDMHRDALTSIDFYGPGSNYLWEDLNLDIVGISAYFPLVDSQPDTVMSEEALEIFWNRIFNEHLLPLKNRNPELPILFLEIGYNDAVASPYYPGSQQSEKIFEDKNGNGLDDGEETQANIYDAFFNVNRQFNSLIEGSFLWGHMMSSDEDWANTFGHWRHIAVRQKLAEEKVKDWYDFYKSEITIKIDTLHAVVGDSVAVPIVLDLPALKEYQSIEIDLYGYQGGLEFLGVDTNSTLSGKEDLNIIIDEQDTLKIQFKQTEKYIHGKGILCNLLFSTKSTGFIPIKIVSSQITPGNDSAILLDGGVIIHSLEDIIITKSRTIPMPDTSIVSGSNLVFLIEIENPSEFPVSYSWYINSELDTNSIDSTFIFYNNRDYEGSDTIEVIVSNAYYSIIHNWIIYSKPYTYPKIIFDETHNQHFSPRLSRAIELIKAEEGENYDPNHIEWVLCDKLINKLRKDYIVTSDTTEPLLLPTLQEADVLFLVPFRIDLSSEERLGIRDFIAQGGNMLVLGLSGWWQANESSDGQLYHLLQYLGFKTHLTVVRSLDDTLWGNSVFMVNLVGSHPATFHADKIQLEGGHKLETTTNFAQIIETTGNLRVWEDINNNGTRDADEPLQSNVGIIGVSEYGEGKVVYISTHMIANDRVDSPTQDVIVSVMKWLTLDVNLVVSVEREEVIIPESFDLSQNYPNPFNPTTTIRFQLPKHSKVSIKIYDVLGREVRTLVEKDFEPGYHIVTWDGSNNSGIKVASGLFFYRMETDGFIKVKKALFLK